MLSHACSVLYDRPNRRFHLNPLCVGPAMHQGRPRCMQARPAARAAARQPMKRAATPRRRCAAGAEVDGGQGSIRAPRRPMAEAMRTFTPSLSMSAASRMTCTGHRAPPHVTDLGVSGDALS